MAQPRAMLLINLNGLLITHLPLQQE